MATETITLKLVAQDLATGNISKAIGRIDALAKQGGIAGSVIQGIGLSFGTMLNPVYLAGRAIGAVTDFFGEATDKAVDLVEAQNKVSVVFGQQADEVHDWAKALDAGFRLSELQAENFVGTVGTLVKAMNLGGDATADLSKELVELGADIASFNNVSVEEALRAISAGLAGETEPLRRFGIDVRVARIRADALADGLGGLSQEASRVNSIFKQAGFLGIRGDALRTADTAVGRAEALRVEYENLQTELGEGLIPLQKSWTEALLGTVKAINAVVEGAGSGITVTTEDVERMAAATEEINQIAADFGRTSTEMFRELAVVMGQDFPSGPIDQLGALEDALSAGIFDSFADDAARAAAETRFWDLQIERLGKSFDDVTKKGVGLGRAFVQVDAAISDLRGSTVGAYYSMLGLNEATVDVKKATGIAVTGWDEANKELQGLVRTAKKMGDENDNTAKRLRIAVRQEKTLRRQQAEAAEKGNARQVAAYQLAINKSEELQGDLRATLSLLKLVQGVKTIRVNIQSNLDVFNSQLASLFGAGGGDTGGNRRAHGGPVGPHQSYVVGERGPEVLTMGNSSGYVTPNHALGGDTYNFTIGYVRDARSFVAEIGPELERWRRGQRVA